MEAIDKKALEDKVIDAIKECYDPEIPVNIWELGLIYEINVTDDPKVNIKMTLTAPGCPAARSLPIEVHERVAQIKEVNDVNVEVVWDPPWTPEMMSQEAKLELGFM
ncbi:MAG: SUF system Fe-S cluster assembly protein [Bacteroidetes bacterium]|nr:SUF system Fe-S cluster assembly protein [Bacteroidota bacterium]MCL5739072.1 SUF system Fe-S cluster assembly protein [Bacteroidota bacterium]